MPYFSSEGISKRYGDQAILKELSLSFAEGSVTAILGASGSGKSTYLKILAGLIDADEGRVFYQGKPLTKPSLMLVPGHEEIRLMPQDLQLKFRMTVKENIRYELLAYTKEYQEERIDYLLTLLKIQHLSNKDVAYLSGGERQRVAIARTLAHEPGIILLDEPFSSLDKNNRSLLLREIKTIAHSTGTTVIMVTHDSSDALEIAQRAVVLQDGKIIADSLPHLLYHQPKSTYTANLFGQYNTVSVGGLQLGVWPEKIVLGSGEHQGSVSEVIRMGPYNKIIMKTENGELLAHDFQQQIQENQQLRYHFPKGATFELN